MTKIPLFLVEKNAALEIEEWLPGILAAKCSQSDMLAFCERFARVALSQILSNGDLDGALTWLSNGAEAFCDWQVRSENQKRCTSSTIQPFAFAIVSGNTRAATGIYQQSLPEFQSGREYEEDFAYARILQTFACVDQPEVEVQRLLDFWKGVSGGGEIRFNLCQALLDKDAKAGKKALKAVLDERRKEVRQRVDDESGDQEGHLSTGQICLEAAAVVRIAERNRGIDLRVKHAQLPDKILVERTTPLPPPEAWKNIDN